MYQRIKDELSHLNEKYIKVWQDVVAIESPTMHKAGVDAVGAYFTRLAEEMGFEIEILPCEKVGNAISITMNPTAKGGAVAFSGHMDTVFPVGSWGETPVTVEGDFIRGPGVKDCKGGVVAAMMAMEALKNVGFTEAKVMLLLQSDEENGSKESGKATIRFICEKAKDCIAFFNCEGMHSDADLTLYRKGILRYTFKVKGIAAHAALCHSEGKSAICEAAHKIIALEKHKEKEGITMSCGLIEGGTASNTVAEECSFTVDVRYSTNDEMLQADRIIKEIASTSYIGNTTCELIKTGDRPAMEKQPRNYALLDRVNAIFEANGMAVCVPAGATGGSDAAYTTDAGIPTLDSIGVNGKSIHTLSEVAYLSSLMISATRLAFCAYGL